MGALEEPLPADVLEDDEFVDETTEYAILFPTLPAEDDPNPPDETDGNLVNELEEMALDEPTAEDDEAPEETADYAFDWFTLEFASTAPNGEPLRVWADEAIVEWVLKALNTPKGEFPIYDEDYGNDLFNILGQTLAEPVLYAEIERSIVECVTYHPRISRCEIEGIRRSRTARGALFVSFSFYIDGEDDPVTLELTA